MALAVKKPSVARGRPLTNQIKVAGRRVEEAAGKSEVNRAPARVDEKAVADRAPYLTNTAPAATKTITAVGPPLTRDRGSPADSRCHPSYLSSDKHEDS